MGCEHYQVEISNLGSKTPAASLAKHIASCQTCSTWLEECRRFDAVWVGEQPSAPEYEWATVWGGVLEARGRQIAQKPMRVRKLAIFGVASSAFVSAAAALMLAFTGAFDRPEVLPETRAPMLLGVVSIDQGETTLIHLADSKLEVEEIEVGDPVAMNFDNLDLLNFFEAKAE